MMKHILLPFRIQIRKPWLSIFLTVFLVLAVPLSAVSQDRILHHYDRLLDVCMLASGTVWAVGHNGLMLVSTDLGSTWMKKNAGTGEGLFSVFFITPEKGWITGESGLILNTTDGGNTWHRQGTGVTEQPLLKCFFISETRGWAAGTFGTVMTTADGGKNWRKTGFSRDMTFNDIYFLTADTGYAACEFEQVMMTRDGGETWHPSMAEGWGDLGHFFGIDLAGNSGAVAVGTSGNIKYTEDSGRTWQPAVNRDVSHSTLLKVGFFNPTHGVAVGLDGAMVFTRDGGRSWDPPRQITQFTWFSGLSLSKDGHGVVVGIGNILVTDDFGKTWHSPFNATM